MSKLACTGLRAIVIAISLCVVPQVFGQGSPDVLWMRGGHVFGIFNGRYSPDGQRIASVADDGTLKIWRSSDGQLIRTIRAHALYARAMAWSPDSQFIATGSSSSPLEVRLWRVSDGAMIWSIPSSVALGANALSFSPDGQRIAIASSPGIVVRSSDGGQLFELKNQFELFGNTAVQYSPDGRYIATNSGNNSRLLLLDSADGSVEHDFGINSVSFGNSIAFSPDGQYLASANGAGVHVYRMFDKSVAFVGGAGQYEFTEVAFSPDGTKLAGGGDNLPANGFLPAAVLWEVGSWSLVRAFTLPDADAGGRPDVTFSPDSRSLLTSWMSMQFWDAVNGSYIEDLSAHSTGIQAVSFTPNGQIFISAGNDKLRDPKIRLWNSLSGTLLRTLDASGATASLSVTPDSSSVIALSINGGTALLQRFRLSDGARLWSHSVGFFSDPKGLIAMVSDGTTFLYGTPSGIELRRVSDGGLIRTIFVSNVQLIAATLDGLNVVTIDSTLAVNGVNVRRLSDGVVVRSFNTLTSAFALSANGQLIAIADTNSRNVSVRRLSDGALLQTMTGHTDRIDALAFAPDGATMISAARGTDASVRVWDVTSGTLLRLYDQETGIGVLGHYGVASLAISADGSQLGFGRGDATVVMAHHPFGPPVNQLPTAIATAPSSVEATSSAGALVPLDGSSSGDPDHDPLTYLWQENGTTLATSMSANVTLALGSHTITLRVTDARGAVASTAFSVQVVDTTGPSVTVPSNITVGTTSANGAEVFFAATASDLVDGSLPAICTPASGSTFPVGTTLVACLATDNHANSGNAPFSVTVTSQLAPQTWRLVAPMQTNRWGHTATLLLNGKVLVTGGSDNTNLHSTVEIYDPVTNTWTAGPAMQNPRARHSATRLNDGRVLVAGGQSASGLYSSTAELYDPATNAWISLPPMKVARSYHAAVLMANGRVLMTGGYTNDPDSFKQYSQDAEVFDPTTRTWTLLASMSIRRVGHLAANLPDGSILVAGGANFAQFESTVEIYNPVTNTWSVAPNMSTQRYAGAGLQLSDGRVLVAGGRFFSPQTSAEVYNPQTNLWASTGSMNDARWFFRMITLGDGRVMAVGGSNASVQISSADIYNPGSGQWASANPMMNSRADHTATLLPDGRVLAVGGYRNGGSDVLSSAEVWSFAAPTELAIAPSTAPFGGATTISMTLTSGGSALAGKTIEFSLFGSSSMSVLTNAQGIATLGPINIGGRDVGVYANAITASFSGDASYSASNSMANLTITPAMPTVEITGGVVAYDGAPHAAMVTVLGTGQTLSPVAVTYNGSVTVPTGPGIYTVVATYPGSLNYLPASGMATLTITDRLINGPTTWSWFQNQWPSRHMAVFPDGKLLLETGNNMTLPILNPQTGSGVLLPADFNAHASSGVAPNPIIWADGPVGYVIGGWGSPVAYRQDGAFKWQWDSYYGCCNVYGSPVLSLDRTQRRLLASFGFRLYSLPLDGGPNFTNDDPPVAYGQGGNATGSISATSTTAYVAGFGSWVTKWDISGATPVYQWSRLLGGEQFWNFSEGAIAADGSFVVTQSGNHASPYWAGSDVWRAGDLQRIAADGQTSWTVSARATTPAVIGQSGLIYVGALAGAGTPQTQLDGAGLIRAYDMNGQEVWSVPTSGLPQDLFIGDDGNVYALTGGTNQGRILVLDQRTGAVRMVIDRLPKPWEIILRDGVVYVAGDSGVVAVPLPAGFAMNYDTQAPWPVRQHDNQRSSQQLYESSLTVNAVTATFSETATLSATLLSNGVPLGGRTIEFSLFGNAIGSAVTNSSGVATLAGLNIAGHNAGVYAGAIRAEFGGFDIYAPSSNTANLTIARKTAAITWSQPVEVIDGTILSGTQLNASSPIPGTFVYTPAAGTVVHTGVQLLSTVFTPTDLVNYAPASGSVQLTVAPPLLVTVISPNGGERVFSGVSYTVKWAASGGVGGPASYNVFYSVNGGSFTPIVECQNLPALVQTCNWTSTKPAASRARIQVIAKDSAGNLKTDLSDGDFKIDPGVPFLRNVQVTAPVYMQTVNTITWEHNLDVGSVVTLYFSSDNGQHWTLIADNVVNSGTGSGSFNWTVPNIATAGAKVKVSWPAGTPGTIEAQSATFAILAPSFAFGAPLAGASWKIGDNRDIKWSYPINPFHVLIEIRRDESDTWTRILDRDQFTRTNGTFVYTWTVTGPPASNKAQIRITDVDRGISGVSPKFTIK